MTSHRDGNDSNDSNGSCDCDCLTQRRKDVKPQERKVARLLCAPFTQSCRPRIFVVETACQAQFQQLPAVLDAAQRVAHGLQPVAFTCSIAQPSADG